MTDPKILFVDDDADILALVEKYLTSQNYNVKTVTNGLTALGMVKDENYDIVFTDYKMPEFNGLELLAAIKRYKPETEVIIVTGYATMESAIEAMKFGSYDYLQKPFNLEHVKLIIERVVEEKKIKDRKDIIRKRSRQRHRLGEMVGIHPKMQEIYEVVESMRVDEPLVFLQGESGTGKALLAKTIHQHSKRNEFPFIPVNCGSVGQGLSEEKMIDHVKGLTQTAEQGTLYLDEISELSSDLRIDLFKSLKSDPEDPNGVRIITGSNKAVDEIIRSGVLKRDMLHLLDAVFIKLPPLRERREDIGILIHHFLFKSYEKHNKMVGFSPEALDILLAYHWPGNIIQLQNVIDRAYALNVKNVITAEELPEEIRTFGKVSKMG